MTWGLGSYSVCDNSPQLKLGASQSIRLILSLIESKDPHAADSRGEHHLTSRAAPTMKCLRKAFLNIVEKWHAHPEMVPLKQLPRTSVLWLPPPLNMHKKLLTIV